MADRELSEYEKELYKQYLVEAAAINDAVRVGKKFSYLGQLFVVLGVCPRTQDKRLFLEDGGYFAHSLSWSGPWTRAWFHAEYFCVNSFVDKTFHACHLPAIDLKP